MSLYHCALTGEPIDKPVVSKISGHIYEARVIEKHLEATGTCPITHQPMNNSDLIDLQVSKSIKPRPVHSASIPNLIGTMQNEWDTILLENYQLKESLNSARQELSHALYQHDAACRVIARLIRERDEARENLTKLAAELRDTQPMEIEQVNKSLLPADINENVSNLSLQLNGERKKRRKDKSYLESFPSGEIISNYSMKFETSLHSANSGIVGISSSPINENLVASAGKDGSTVLFDLSSKKSLATGSSTKKPLTEISFSHTSPNLFSTSSEDKTVKLWKYNNSNKLENSFSFSHKSIVKSCAIHPADLLFASAANGDWSIHDINTLKLLAQDKILGANNEFTNVLRIHPDGHVIGGGMSNGKVNIYSISENSVMATLDAHDSLVNNLCFSGNGYHLATSSNTGVVKLWDLRNLKNFANLLEGDNLKIGSMAFDSAGQYFAVGGLDLHLFSVKTSDSIAKFSSNKHLITGISFGEFSKSIVTGSLDRQLTVLSQ